MATRRRPYLPISTSCSVTTVTTAVTPTSGAICRARTSSAGRGCPTGRSRRWTLLPTTHPEPLNAADSPGGGSRHLWLAMVLGIALAIVVFAAGMFAFRGDGDRTNFGV